MAELAPRHDAHLRFLALPDRPFPLPALAVPRMLPRVQADVLVIDSIAAAYFGPWLALRQLTDRPMVAMLHQPPGGVDHGPLRAAVQTWLDRLAYARVSRLMVASESLRDELVRQGIAPERLVVIPPGRDVARATGPVPGDLREGRRMALLCIANWLPNKRILELLEAVALLPKSAVTLHLVGDDRADPRYAARVRKRLVQPDLSDRVIVHGLLPPERVAALYQAADAFALFSRHETYGTVYGEAMSFGLPVVGPRSGNLPYLAEDEREGLFVEPDDVPGLAVALNRLVDDSDLHRRLGENARLRALSRPTWDESAANFFGVLREVADRRISH